jgi:hypothetical protein
MQAALRNGSVFCERLCKRSTRSIKDSAKWHRVLQMHGYEITTRSAKGSAISQRLMQRVCKMVVLSAKKICKKSASSSIIVKWSFVRVGGQ